MSDNLNLTRFAKVIALAQSAPHGDPDHSEQERSAAWSKAEEMAQAAGLTLTEALSKIDATSDQASLRTTDQPARRSNPFADFFQDVMDKRREAASREWPEHPYEARLRVALVGHDIQGRGLYIDELPASTIDALKGALPWPSTMSEAAAELAIWDALEAERRAAAEHYSLSDGPMARRFLVRDVLQREASTPDDAVARAEWAATAGLDSYEMSEQVAWMAADMRMVRDAIAQPTQRPMRPPAVENAPRTTNQEKRERVRAILREPGGSLLSLRVIAKRAGVSVQGAANIRASLAGEMSKVDTD